MAAFLLTIDPVHWLCSEKIWIETTLCLFFYLAILFFILAIEKDKLNSYIMCGVFTGLAILSKYPGTLILPIIFSYLYLYKPESLFKIKSYFLLLIPALMLIPWMIWNYSVYGDSFLTEMAVASYSKYKFIFIKILNPQALFSLVIALSVIIAVLLITRVKFKKSFLIFNYFIFALIFGGALFMLASAGFRRSLVNMMDLFYLPQAGWQMGMFGDQPWYFYFMRLLELSPIYLFSFIGILFFLRQTQKAKLLSIIVIWVMAAFILLRNFQSRYILMAIPALSILASDTMIKIWMKLKEKIKSEKILVFSQTFLILLVMFFLLKTIIVDLKLAVPNWPCYF